MGTAAWQLALPANPQLLASPLFAQVLAIAPGANAANLVASRGLAITTGW